AEPQYQRGTALRYRLTERHEREGAALAVVIGAQQDDDVLQRDDKQKRPQDERQHAEHSLAASEARGLGRDDCFVEGVERACAEVTVDDADGPDDERPKMLVESVVGLLEAL